MPQGETRRFVSPQGEIWDVPAQYSDQAIAMGGKEIGPSYSERLGEGAQSGVSLGRDILEGLGSSLGGVALGTSKLLGRVPAQTTLEDIGLEPRGPLQGAIKTGADIGQFLLPQRGVLTGTQILSKLPYLARFARPAMEALSAGAVGTAQTGSPEEGAITGAAAGGVAGGLANIKEIPALASRLRGPAKAAMEWAERQGIPMSTGQQLGIRSLEKFEKTLENLFGAAGKAQRFFGLQGEKIVETGKRLVGGPAATEFEAGEAATSKVKQIIDSAKTRADELYDNIRQMYSEGKVTEPGKVKLVERTRPDGTTWTEYVRSPDILRETPIDVANAKKMLRPTFNTLSETMPEAQRQSSPGYKAMKELMEGPDTLDAVIADRNLSAIKAITRAGKNPYLTDRSQGIAKLATDAYSAAIDAGLNAVNPRLLPTLAEARQVVYKQHAVAEILNDLPKEPAQLYSKLVSPGDKSFSRLTILNGLAPQEMKEVGRTFLSGMLQKMAEEGDITRAAGTFRAWGNMGPHTKRLLFGTLTPELDNFFLAAKRLSADVNPSGSAKLILAAGPILDFTYGSGDLPTRTKRAATEVGGAYIASRLLLNPAALRSITQLFNRLSPLGPPAAGAVTSLAVRPQQKE